MSKALLVHMPFATVTMPSLALGLLKSVLQEKNIEADTCYLNVRFLRYLDLSLHEKICHVDYYAAEWIFSQNLNHEDQFPLIKSEYNKYISGVIDEDPLVYKFLRTNKETVIQLVTKDIPEFIDECLDCIPWNAYEVVGFKCIIGCQLATFLLSKRLKERFPHLKIVCGGPNVRGIMGVEILKHFKYIDYIIDGEGERELPDLIRCICNQENCEHIEGLIYRKNSVILHNKTAQELMSLEMLPIPDYDDYFKEINAKELPIGKDNIGMIYESSRGCWWGEKKQCNFCSLCNGFLNYRSKSASKVMDEINELLEKYGVDRFYSTDCILNYDYFNNFIIDLTEKNLGIQLFYEIKPNLGKDRVRMLYQAGVRNIQAGIESLSTDILHLMNKGGSAIQNIYFIRICTEVNMMVDWNILYRIPGEKLEYYDSIIELIPSIIHLSSPTANRPKMIDLHRYSPYFERPEDYSITDIIPLRIYQSLYPDESIDLQNIASTFHFSFKDADHTVKMYYNRLCNSISEWQAAFAEKRYHCNYTLKGDAIYISDNRPINIERNKQERTYQLGEVEKWIVILCDEVQTFDKLVQQIKTRYRYNISREELKKVLYKLTREYRLLFEENNRYISIITNYTM